ncbi:MauE/DoxX family redox-associated membrane protein [Nocardia sp. AG03]|uniref:peroxiredoxin family protein n=1 Tax=Nocardia sp. AG03 TaxID=3025312 RepID=UPI00241891E9|nr:MauE/DoxX family redox-associated membrane protein [Nocardia sp. AG03]
MLIEYGVWGSRLVLAAVFGLAAWGKFRDRPEARKSVAEFGVPLRLVPGVAIGLPILEALVALALLPPWTAGAAGVVAVVLLGGFTLAILRLLRRGERPDCACFGAVGAAPIGWATVVRNGLLMVLAVLVVVGSLSRPQAPAGLPVDAAVGLVLITVLGAALVRIFGELGELRRRVDAQALSTLGGEGLPVGAVAPEFELRTTEDDRVDLGSLLSDGKALLLVFVHPGCEMCAALARELPRWQSRNAELVTIVLVGNGDLAEHAEWARAQGIDGIPVLVQQGNEAALRYRVRGTPSGVLIDPDGRIAASVARGAIAVRELVVAAKSTRRGRVTGELVATAPR